MEELIKATYSQEIPSEISEQIAKRYSKNIPKEHKKRIGQFFTPLIIAKFMAGLFNIDLAQKKVRILDPGCGALTLTCTLVERLILQNKNIKEIEIDAYDTDPSLSNIVNIISTSLKDWGYSYGVKVEINYFDSDFLLANESILKDDSGSLIYDLIISNPPYFKIGKQDARLSIFNISFHGQQNIYSLFLIGAAKLLKKNGQIVFVVPRSFTSGLYFQSFREAFLEKITVKYFHIFDSRTNGFKNDHVLQENVILKAIHRNDTPPHVVKISHSSGVEDLNRSKEKEFSTDFLIKKLGKLKIIHLPSTSFEEQAMHLVSTWTHNLSSFGMKVSTGPVVPFRCRTYLKHLQPVNSNCVPMLWMHNCLKMELRWPSQKENKEAWIIDNSLSNSKTIKNQNYILLRRFSSKEDHSKIVATPYLEENFLYSRIGIENHLNYLYKPNGALEINEIFGLSVLYNSTLFDAYFRSLNGNTQVSATELNSIPLPPVELIREIGEQYISLNGQGKEKIDSIVNRILNLP